MSSPVTAAELRSTLSAAIIETLVQKFAGLEIYVPKSMSTVSALVPSLGWEVTDVLVRNFPGREIYIPMTALTEDRHEAARELMALGLGDAEIARRMNVTSRSVRTYRARARQVILDSDGPKPAAIEAMIAAGVSDFNRRQDSLVRLIQAGLSDKEIQHITVCTKKDLLHARMKSTGKLPASNEGRAA